MDMQSVMTAISTLGFPIVACAAMFWLNWKSEERHDAEIKELQTAINNNTIALTKLLERFDMEEK